MLVINPYKQNLNPNYPMASVPALSAPAPVLTSSMPINLKQRPLIYQPMPDNESPVMQHIMNLEEQMYHQLAL